jgi:SAM-dependent methyltransferase
MTQFLMSALKNIVHRPPFGLAGLTGADYWKKRVKRYGRRAVLNIGHSDAEYENVTRAEKAVYFPLLRKMLRGDERTVLDFGCGAGRFTVDLATTMGGYCFGVDPTPELLKMAPRSERVEYVLLKDGEVPLPDGSMDVVWLSLVLGCITSPRELKKAAHEIRRVLNDDGLLFLIENTTDRPNAPHWHYRPPEFYQVLFDFVHLEHLDDHTDVGERYSIMAGRKVSPKETLDAAVVAHSGHAW